MGLRTQAYLYTLRPDFVASSLAHCLVHGNPLFLEQPVHKAKLLIVMLRLQL